LGGIPAGKVIHLSGRPAESGRNGSSGMDVPICLSMHYPCTIHASEWALTGGERKRGKRKDFQMTDFEIIDLGAMEVEGEPPRAFSDEKAYSSVGGEWRGSLFQRAMPFRGLLCRTMCSSQ